MWSSNPQERLKQGTAHPRGRAILIDEGLLHQPQQGVPTFVKARPAAIGVPEALTRAQDAHRTLGVELEALAAALGD